MVTIKDTLALEHVFLGRLFAEIARVVPDLHTLDQTRLLCRIVESLLSRHADLEENLAYAALDHALAERGDLEQMHRDHEEIDGRFEQARRATDPTEARRLLVEALEASGRHFRWEEDSVFPLLDRVLAAATQEALAAAASLQFGPGSANRPGDVPARTGRSAASN
jgi:hemerythrin-like domain-containing protein